VAPYWHRPYEPAIFVIQFFRQNFLALKNTLERVRRKIRPPRLMAIGSARRLEATRVMLGVASSAIAWQLIALVAASLPQMPRNPGFLLQNLSKSRARNTPRQLPNPP
jgi:hypothetical protein